MSGEIVLNDDERRLIEYKRAVEASLQVLSRSSLAVSWRDVHMARRVLEAVQAGEPLPEWVK